MKIIKRLIIDLGLKDLALFLLGLMREFKTRHKWSEIQKSGCVWLELGSGPKEGTNGWTTVDLNGGDIAYDLRKGIPLPDNSVDRIYTSHMFEHIPYKNLVLFIAECYRVLKKDGELSVCVPNAGFYINAYSNGDIFLDEKKCYEPARVDTGSLIDQVNYIAYMDGQHNYMFDECNLIKTIKKSPFTLVELRDFDPQLDLQSRDFESIYACAIK